MHSARVCARENLVRHTTPSRWACSPNIPQGAAGGTPQATNPKDEDSDPLFGDFSGTFRGGGPGLLKSSMELEISRAICFQKEQLNSEQGPSHTLDLSHSRQVV